MECLPLLDLQLCVFSFPLSTYGPVMYSHCILKINLLIREVLEGHAQSVVNYSGLQMGRIVSILYSFCHSFLTFFNLAAYIIREKFVLK